MFIFTLKSWILNFIIFKPSYRVDIFGIWIQSMLTLASLIPVSFVFGRSKTRKAAKLAVYEATIIIAKPAHTIPKTRAEKLRGVPVRLI